MDYNMFHYEKDGRGGFRGRAVGAAAPLSSCILRKFLH